MEYTHMDKRFVDAMRVLELLMGGMSNRGDVEDACVRPEFPFLDRGDCGECDDGGECGDYGDCEDCGSECHGESCPGHCSDGRCDIPMREDGDVDVGVDGRESVNGGDDESDDFIGGVAFNDILDDVKQVIFNDPATIVTFSDGSKVCVKACSKDRFNKETGLIYAIIKRLYANDIDERNGYCKSVGLGEKIAKILAKATDQKESPRELRRKQAKDAKRNPGRSTKDVTTKGSAKDDNAKGNAKDVATKGNAKGGKKLTD